MIYTNTLICNRFRIPLVFSWDLFASEKFLSTNLLRCGFFAHLCSGRIFRFGVVDALPFFEPKIAEPTFFMILILVPQTLTLTLSKFFKLGIVEINLYFLPSKSFVARNLLSKYVFWQQCSGWKGTEIEIVILWYSSL